MIVIICEFVNEFKEASSMLYYRVSVVDPYLKGIKYFSK